MTRWCPWRRDLATFQNLFFGCTTAGRPFASQVETAVFHFQHSSCSRRSLAPPGRFEEAYSPDGFLPTIVLCRLYIRPIHARPGSSLRNSSWVWDYEIEERHRQFRLSRRVYVYAVLAPCNGRCNIDHGLFYWRTVSRQIVVGRGRGYITLASLHSLNRQPNAVSSSSPSPACICVLDHMCWPAPASLVHAMHPYLPCCCAVAMMARVI